MYDKIKSLTEENTRLEREVHSSMISNFFDYIEIGSTHRFESYVYLTGVQTGKKEVYKDRVVDVDSNFIEGDVIEFIKKNQKSIVIKCVTKYRQVYDPYTKTTTKVLDDKIKNMTFRIQIDSLYNNLIQRDADLKSRFDKYLKRKQSLELLGI